MQGIGALDPINGVPLTWNPGKDRGVGVFDIYLTTDGVYIGSDTDNVAGEWHPKFAMFPLTGGTVPPAATPISLPADLYWGSSTANTLSKAAYDGSAFGPTTTVSHPLTWSAVRSAFWEAGKLYYVTGASMFSRTWDGTTFGPEVNLNTWPNWTTVTAMDWDGGKLYYTDGSTNLYYRYFSLESGIVGSQTFTVSTSTDNASWSTTAGIFVAGNHLYQARTNGQLWRWDLVNADIVAGTGVMVASTGWNVQDLFLADFDDEPDLPPTVDLTAPAAGATVSGSAVTVSATATDDDELDHVEFFTNGASIGVDTDGSDGWSVAWDSTGDRRRHDFADRGGHRQHRPDDRLGRSHGDRRQRRAHGEHHRAGWRGHRLGHGGDRLGERLRHRGALQGRVLRQRHLDRYRHQRSRRLGRHLGRHRPCPTAPST